MTTATSPTTRLALAPLPAPLGSLVTVDAPLPVPVEGPVQRFNRIDEAVGQMNEQVAKLATSVGPHSKLVERHRRTGDRTFTAGAISTFGTLGTGVWGAFEAASAAGSPTLIFAGAGIALASAVGSFAMMRRSDRARAAAERREITSTEINGLEACLDGLTSDERDALKPALRLLTTPLRARLSAKAEHALDTLLVGTTEENAATRTARISALVAAALNGAPLDCNAVRAVIDAATPDERPVIADYLDCKLFELDETYRLTDNQSRAVHALILRAREDAA